MARARVASFALGLVPFGWFVPPALAQAARPGSLLLFAEYDNAGATLLTVTNADPAFPSPGIETRWMYVDEGTCAVTERAELLRPSDTLSVVTAAHHPGATRGYVYAYAADPLTHRPVAYNHLVGASRRFDPVTGSSYSIEPATFVSGPLAEMQPTDLDDDGVRDLDGNEYARVPDQVLVPRFLGQSSSVQSALILVGLLASSSTTTTATMLIFNDNEEVFSQQIAFGCWGRVPLLTAGGSFDNTFLSLTNHAPFEIAGWTGQESGWFKVNGQQATSAGGVVDDPPLLAFLVESSARSAAGPPFGEGLQANGGLPRPGLPPSCGSGTGVVLWPPNHKVVDIDLATAAGVSDPANLAVQIQITSITQDEPVSGGGDGNTPCDGAGLGTSIARIRAERAGNGNGRVYAIHYVATNSLGLSCAGVFGVSVPKFQNGNPAVDDGQVHNSTEGCP